MVGTCGEVCRFDRILWIPVLNLSRPRSDDVHSYKRPPFYLRTRPGNLLYRFIDSPGYTSWSITISFFQGVSALLFIRQTVETPVYLFLSFWNLSISLFRHSLWKSHNHSNIFTDLWMRPLIKFKVVGIEMNSFNYL